ncbi:MAG: ATP-binding protein [Bacteroidetes bacterium]|nr:ATP-binding protein [Bacteroidota bacterium]
MITRAIEAYVEKLRKQFPAVALLGPRQCGKTTIAKNIKQKMGDKAIYFDLESPADNRKLEDPELFLLNTSARLIILDEIQRRPELFAILRSVIDRKRTNGRFLILGSATPELVAGASESLAGRIYYLDAHPFSLPEIRDHRNAPKHWFRGGFPGAFLARGEDEFHNWMTTFTRTFIERDLNQLFGTSFSTQVMSRLWRMIAHAHGQLWNANSFAKGLDISPTTVNRYVDHLEGAYIVRRLHPYYFNSRKRLTKSPKIYIRDSGILHFLAGITDQDILHQHPIVGHSWEGYVIEEICRKLGSNMMPYFYRTHDGGEIDLVLVKGIKPVACIEIKYSSSPSKTKSMTEGIKDLRTTHNFIIIPGNDATWKMSERVLVCNLQEFLDRYLPALMK